MKKIVCLLLVFAIALSITGCGSGSSERSIPEDDGTKIPVPDVAGMTLSEAIKSLNEAGFTNIKSNYDPATQPADSIYVVGQSKKAGTNIKPEDEVSLTCKKTCELYLDLASDSNLLFDKYDMEIKLDGNEIGIVSNGERFTKLVTVLEGDHELVISKSGDPSTNAKRKLNVQGPLTFSALVRHGSSIDFQDSKIEDNVAGASLAVPSVEKKVLTYALNVLKNQGFVNIRYEPNSDIWDTDNWFTIEQSVPEGTELDKNDQIILRCIKTNGFLGETFKGITVAEAVELARSMGFYIQTFKADGFGDLTEQVNNADAETLQEWDVESATVVSANKISVKMVHMGTQEERAATEELERIQKTLESSFPIENAKKAIVVAFTNFSSEDVFTADGNSYDPSKFHGYNYDGDFKQTITDEGTWTAVNETTWHVENMYLKLKNFSLRTKLKCDITFDGEEYTLTHIKFITGGSKEYIDKEDPSKTSGWETAEPGDFYKMFVVPSNMVTGNAGVNKSDTVVTSSYGTNDTYKDWVGDQFSSWDGSHKALTKLIKKRLNDEKSYKHIETNFRACTTKTDVDAMNDLLKSGGYTQRVELNDLFITTQFSAKNSFNATIKATAIGIARYRDNTIILVDMG